jgi:FkbM family methyltransferase
MKAIYGAWEWSETEAVATFFGEARSGYFVEVGANEPEERSQTWHLERRGWTGALVEPQPALAARLREARTAKVYEVACSAPRNTGSTMRLHLAGVHSSLDPNLNISTITPHGAIDVPVTTLDQVLSDAQAPVPIDFLSIDVEGHEVEVLEGFDIARWRPRLIYVEDLVMDLRLHRHLTARGYKWVRRIDINSWYVPAHNPMGVSPIGRLQFVRKYYLGTPFRHLRESVRRIRHRGAQRRQ